MRNKYLQRPAHPESITQFKLLFAPSQKMLGNGPQVSLYCGACSAKFNTCLAYIEQRLNTTQRNAVQEMEIKQNENKTANRKPKTENRKSKTENLKTKNQKPKTKNEKRKTKNEK
jgi:hypothetical protein